MTVVLRLNHSRSPSEAHHCRSPSTNVAHHYCCWSRSPSEVHHFRRSSEAHHCRSAPTEDTGNENVFTMIGSSPIELFHGSGTTPSLIMPHSPNSLRLLRPSGALVVDEGTRSRSNVLQMTAARPELRHLAHR